MILYKVKHLEIEANNQLQFSILAQYSSIVKWNGGTRFWYSANNPYHRNCIEKFDFFVFAYKLTIYRFIDLYICDAIVKLPNEYCKF